MATICMQCGLEGFVKFNGELKSGHENFVQSFGVVDDATPEEHMARVHPDGIDPVQRQELERRAIEIFQRTHRV